MLAETLDASLTAAAELPGGGGLLPDLARYVGERRS
jgi:hypothetical protein